MSAPIIFHTQHSINCSKFVNQVMKGVQNIKYYKHYHNYLIPYHCISVDQQNRMIFGNFVHPMWNTLERHFLAKGTNFGHSYIKGNNFVIECTPSTLKDYHVFGKTFVYANGIRACEHTIKDNSLLLFSIHKDIAAPLIQNKLL